MQTKEEVLIRSGYKCSICGWGGAQCIVNVHHIHSKSDGGSDMTINQIVLCPNHHTVLQAIIDRSLERKDLEEFGFEEDEIHKLVVLARATTIFTLVNNVRTFTDSDISQALKDLYDSTMSEVDELKESLMT